jgi:MoxR-like ATPase
MAPVTAGTRPVGIDELTDELAARAYLADRGLATVLHVALALGKPLLLEGEAGVGKTEVAKTLADVLGARLIRLQCYEGIDSAHALYDWSYARQMLAIRLLELGTHEGAPAAAVSDLFGRDFLVRRPLLDAIEHDDPVPPVLLVDEIDRADDEFEAFLLELLSDFQVTIPEIGTIRAEHRPVVILTSNRTRELHDALKRRCLYHWIGHPSLEREIAIVRARVPGVPERLAAEAAAFVERLRSLDLAKQPGVAETIYWTQALVALGQGELDAGLVDATLGSVLKYHEDLERVRDQGLQELVAEAKRSAAEQARSG